MADLWALLCVVFSCVFVTFPYGVPGQVLYLIVSIPDLCVFCIFLFNLVSSDKYSVLHSVFIYISAA